MEGGPRSFGTWAALGRLRESLGRPSMWVPLVWGALEDSLIQPTAQTFMQILSPSSHCRRLWSLGVAPLAEASFHGMSWIQFLARPGLSCRQPPGPRICPPSRSGSQGILDRTRKSDPNFSSLYCPYRSFRTAEHPLHPLTMDS